MENKRKALDEIAAEIEHCRVCRQEKSGKAVPGEGNPDADVVFIGEAPGKTEAQTGRPFIGRSGQLLRGLIRDAGFREDEVFITSPVKYLPDRGTPTDADIAHGRIHLMEQFAVIEPKFVVLLGSVACRGVLGEKHSVMTEHGTLIKKDGISYLITIHPAAVLRFPKYREIIEGDFKKIKDMLQLK